VRKREPWVREKIVKIHGKIGSLARTIVLGKKKKKEVEEN